METINPTWTPPTITQFKKDYKEYFTKDNLLEDLYDDCRSSSGGSISGQVLYKIFTDKYGSPPNSWEKHFIDQFTFLSQMTKKYSILESYFKSKVKNALIMLVSIMSTVYRSE